MYGVIDSKKKIIHYVATLEEAKELRNKMIANNEFYFMHSNIYGEYKIVKLQIEIIKEE